MRANGLVLRGLKLSTSYTKRDINLVDFYLKTATLFEAEIRIKARASIIDSSVYGHRNSFSVEGF